MPGRSSGSAVNAPRSCRRKPLHRLEARLKPNGPWQSRMHGWVCLARGHGTQRDARTCRLWCNGSLACRTEGTSVVGCPLLRHPPVASAAGADPAACEWVRSTNGLRGRRDYIGGCDGLSSGCGKVQPVVGNTTEAQPHHLPKSQLWPKRPAIGPTSPQTSRVLLAAKRLETGMILLPYFAQVSEKLLPLAATPATPAMRAEMSPAHKAFRLPSMGHCATA